MWKVCGAEVTDVCRTPSSHGDTCILGLKAYLGCQPGILVYASFVGACSTSEGGPKAKELQDGHSRVWQVTWL